ncbi:hypothetical protein ACFP3I_04710 [Chryseobacterium arachidis]
MNLIFIECHNYFISKKMNNERQKMNGNTLQWYCKASTTNG